ncbi:MAG TPA: AMP-binding protein [Rhodopila sp.]
MPDVMAAVRAVLVQVPVTEIFAAAALTPHAEALRHKRRGRWRAWSWADLRTESEGLAQALRERGIDDRSVVAISGDYAPGLVIFAIAAARAGARVVAVPTGIARVDLAAWLREKPVALAFVGLREQLGTWRGALREAACQAEIIVDFHLPWGHPSASGQTAAADLLGDAARGREARRPASEVLWIEEGTDWSDGLGFILHALALAATLAFPESRTAAGRDRREIQPARFALSVTHHAMLAGDLTTRLAAGPSLAAWLTRNALSAARGGSARWHQRWLLGRIRRPFGLARTRELTVVGLPDAAPVDGARVDLFAALGIPARWAAPPSTPVGQAASFFPVFA